MRTSRTAAILATVIAVSGFGAASTASAAGLDSAAQTRVIRSEAQQARVIRSEAQQSRVIRSEAKQSRVIRSEAKQSRVIRSAKQTRVIRSAKPAPKKVVTSVAKKVVAKKK